MGGRVAVQAANRGHSRVPATSLQGLFSHLARVMPQALDMSEPDTGKGPGRPHVREGQCWALDPPLPAQPRPAG